MFYSINQIFIYVYRGHGRLGGPEGMKTVSVSRGLGPSLELGGCPTNRVVINQNSSALRKQRREDLLIIGVNDKDF